MTAWIRCRYRPGMDPMETPRDEGLDVIEELGLLSDEGWTSTHD